MEKPDETTKDTKEHEGLRSYFEFLRVLRGQLLSFSVPPCLRGEKAFDILPSP